MKHIAIYAGSFDPITNGHLWMIAEGAKLFDKLIVLVADNPNKKCLFSVYGRIEMVNDAIGYELDTNELNIEVCQLENEYTIKRAKEKGAAYLLRGIRTVSDFDYERALRLINNDIDQDVQTVFLMPPRDLAEISSSLVKGLVGFPGWEELISKYVPKNVVDAFKSGKNLQSTLDRY
jgi:pantetheine-phosphate adenylyltransferase